MTWRIIAILCGLLATAGATPADVPSGIRFAPSKHAKAFRDLYAHLPVCWRSKRSVRVREVSDIEMDSEYDFWPPGSVDGYYTEPLRGEAATISIRASLSEPYVTQVFAHEYGHHVWFSVLRPSQRNAYRNLWLRRRETHELVSDYAETRLGEGWAESFAYYQCDIATLVDCDEESLIFIWRLEHTIGTNKQRH